MKLIVYTNPYELKFETEIINRLFREGLEELHVRKPLFNKEEYEHFIKQIDEKYHSKIVLHNHVRLFKKYNVLGIHLENEIRKSKFWMFLLKTFFLKNEKIKIYATSNNYHSLYQNIENVDTMLLGPVFSKTSEIQLNLLIPQEKLSKALQNSNFEVYGMGGTYKEKLPFFEEIGFEGAVLQSSIWKAIEPIKAFIELRDYKQSQVAIPKLKVV